jgi:hypothetical protein
MVAALPLDVRWRLCLTVQVSLEISGAAPRHQGQSPEFMEACSGRAEPFRTSGGKAASVDSTILLARFGCQTEAWFDSFVTTRDSGGDIFSHNGPVFEPVAGTAADQPNISKLRMTIDEEVAA